MNDAVLGLDHLLLAMPAGGEGAAREFYGDLLRLPELAKPDELVGRGGCWFALPNLQLHLGIEDEFAPAIKAHPAFSVGDLEGLRRRLEGAGVSITPDASLSDQKRFFCADPFGNRLEFLETPTEAAKL